MMKHLKKFESIREEESYRLTKEDKDRICSAIDNEGFSYAFIDYSSFPEIKDEEFHRLRKEFIKAQRALEKYVGWDEWDD